MAIVWSPFFDAIDGLTIINLIVKVHDEGGEGVVRAGKGQGHKFTSFSLFYSR